MTKIGTQTGSFASARYKLTRSILENALQKNYTAKDYEAALKFFGGCAFCGRGKRKATRKDHLVPVIQCGDFTIRNVVPACQECDDSKRDEEYHKWMRNSKSRHSLKARGFTDKQLEERIKRIEKWQSGYAALTKDELFGEDYDSYKKILQKMKQLCEEAELISSRVRSRNRKSRGDKAYVSQSSKSAVSTADKIRSFVDTNYITPARNRGQKTIRVRAGNVHTKMSLHGLYRDVCQSMNGSKFLKRANVRLKSVSGPEGPNRYFTYQL